MSKISVRLLIAICFASSVGCQTQPHSSENIRPDISLDAAKDLMLSGRVQSIFQPHLGCVVLTLQDGQLLTFEQPHLDWVALFVKEQGLAGVIPVSME